jgi:predicted nucleic acid-binding protein
LHYLILDTCVWVDLAVSEFSLVAKLARLINDAKASIVIPELVRTEWYGCQMTIGKQIANEVVEARRSAMRFVSFMDEIEHTGLSTQLSSADPKSMGQQIAAHRIAAIEAILNSDASICVPVSAQAETLAIRHALEKKAPFRMRNSMADALIFLAAVEWVEDQKPDNSVFVTHNTKDFSDEKRADDDISFKERLAPDLQLLVEDNGMTFCAVIGRVLNDIEQSVATEVEVERGETVVARTRLEDDAIEELISGGAVAMMLEQQKKIEELLSGGAIGRMLEQQKKFEEMTSGGAIAKMMEQQKKIKEMFKRFK